MLHSVSLGNQIPLGYHQVTSHLFFWILLQTPPAAKGNTHQSCYLLCPDNTVLVKANYLTRTIKAAIKVNEIYGSTCTEDALAQQRVDKKYSKTHRTVYFKVSNYWISEGICCNLLHSLLPDFCQASSVTEGKWKNTYFPHTVPHACAISAGIHLRWRLHPIQLLVDSGQMCGQADRPGSSLGVRRITPPIFRESYLKFSPLPFTWDLDATSNFLLYSSLRKENWNYNSQKEGTAV